MFKLEKGKDGLAPGGERNDVVEFIDSRFQKTTDVARGLPDALLILDQRDANILVAMLAEADARRNGHIGLLDQKFGEFDRAHAAERLRQFRPGKHRR